MRGEGATDLYGLRSNIDELLLIRRDAINTLRNETADVLPNDPFYDEIFLLRFVLTHSKKGTLELAKAAEAVRKTVKFRTDHAAILEETVRTGKAPYHDKCMKFLTCGYAGDLGGYEPIYIVRTGHCNAKGLMAAMTGDQVRDWMHFSREIVFRICDERTRKTRMLIKGITVMDMAGYSLFAGDSRMNKSQAASAELSSIIYPQLLGKTVITNMQPLLSTVLKAAISLLPQSVAEKVAICSQSNTETCGKTAIACPFIRRLDGTPNALPAFLGGAMPCPADLIARSELSSALTRVTVSSRSATTVDFDVPVPSTASWEVVVEDFGIDMEASFLPLLGGAAEGEPARYGEAVCVLPRRKIKTAEGLAEGALALPGRGLLRVVFDNSYSLLRSKTLDYRIWVQPDAS